jgi:Mg-chelatase subunit ChlI
MSYQTNVAQVAAAHIEEIAGDLDQARSALKRARSNVAQLERQVASLEGLLDLAHKAGGEAEAAGLTLHDAMAEVLRTAQGGMLRAGDLAAEIERRRLYRMRDGRPVEAQQIHARVGHYPHLFAKEGTFIRLAE